ncbi:hypothetical protein Pcinc_038616 [Petrolisthes cinctipes]|uniref:Uncharacterized protein n=1 Tax=Petrolisthes cinctipes TaxID=88211 RepID=A0AAE1BU23_PETCI|nr:hypothetical protein Pcinc_038616 [Petrolisthes cinctipes]
MREGVGWIEGGRGYAYWMLHGDSSLFSTDPSRIRPWLVILLFALPKPNPVASYHTFRSLPSILSHLPSPPRLSSPFP